MSLCHTMYGESYDKLDNEKKLIVVIATILSFILGTIIIYYGWNVIATHYGVKTIDLYHAFIMRLVLFGFLM